MLQKHRRASGRSEVGETSWCPLVPRLSCTRGAQTTLIHVCVFASQWQVTTSWMFFTYVSFSLYVWRFALRSINTLFSLVFLGLPSFWPFLCFLLKTCLVVNPADDFDKPTRFSVYLPLNGRHQFNLTVSFRQLIMNIQYYCEDRGLMLFVAFGFWMFLKTICQNAFYKPCD